MSRELSSVQIEQFLDSASQGKRFYLSRMYIAFSCNTSKEKNLNFVLLTHVGIPLILLKNYCILLYSLYSSGKFIIMYLKGCKNFSKLFLKFY